MVGPSIRAAIRGACHPHAMLPHDDAHGAHVDGHGLPGHRHPHPPDDPSGHPRIGFIGAGHVGNALALAMLRAGWPVAAVSSRDPGRVQRFRSLVPTARALPLQAIVDEVDLVFLTVPDDAIPAVVSRLRLYGGQAIVHTSGALAADVLAPALAAGSIAGSFHPLVAFAELERSVAALRGAIVALEGDVGLLTLLAELASDLGAQPVLLPPGGKPAYHAAAVLSAGGFVGLLDAIAEVARGAGLDEAGALAIYAPLIRQTLANAEALGIAAALTGPLLRGDLSTIRGHLDALDRLAPGARELYRAAARREVALAVGRGELPLDRATAISALLGPAPAD